MKTTIETTIKQLVEIGWNAPEELWGLLGNAENRSGKIIFTWSDEDDCYFCQTEEIKECELGYLSVNWINQDFPTSSDDLEGLQS